MTKHFVFYFHLSKLHCTFAAYIHRLVSNQTMQKTNMVDIINTIDTLGFTWKSANISSLLAIVDIYPKYLKDNVSVLTSSLLYLKHNDILVTAMLGTRICLGFRRLFGWPSNFFHEMAPVVPVLYKLYFYMFYNSLLLNTLRY